MKEEDVTRITNELGWIYEAIRDLVTEFNTLNNNIVAIANNLAVGGGMVIPDESKTISKGDTQVSLRP